MDDVLIVGGGIGGLALALALHAKGIGCRVLEAADEYRMIGAGVNILPHAVAIFAELGLEQDLSSFANKTTGLRFYNQHGQEIHSELRGLAGGHTWPQYSVHRGDLHRVLLKAFKERIGSQNLIMCCRCLSVDETGTGVVVRARRNGGEASFTAGLAVGCDGIHSQVRKRICPGDAGPIFSGVTMWRGVTETASFLDGSTMILAGALRTGKIVAYPIRPADQRTGMQLVNWVAEIRTGQEHSIEWDHAGNKHDLDWAYRDWQLPWLDVASMLRGTTTVLQYPMVDKNPLSHWTRGRITLLGDAAHPMYPFGSNGACQAVLDAHTLAECISICSSVEAALKQYELVRLPVTSEVTLLNRVSPPDVILDEVDRLTNGLPVSDIRSFIGADRLRSIMTRYQNVTARPPIATTPTAVADAAP